MNFQEKLNVILKELEVVYGLERGQVALLRKNILERYEMYKDIIPNFNLKETRVIKNNHDVGDLLLNRLVMNIRNYDLSAPYNPNITDKGTYTAKRQKLQLENYKSIHDVTYDKLQRRINNLDKKTVDLATQKVFNHEIGHALQTAFSGSVGENDVKFRKLLDNLASKYPTEFSNNLENLFLSSEQAGMIPVKKDDSKKIIRSFYSRIALTTHLDEIFNDDEALAVTGANEVQFDYPMANNISKPIYNYESSNYKITSYGRMMKIIMGEERTFRAMYEDSIEAYEFFDQFTGLSDSVFKGTKYSGSAPMLNVLNSFEQVRNNNSLSDGLRLDLFFTLCLQRKVAHDLKNPNLDINGLRNIYTYVKQFMAQTIKGDGITLEHDKVIKKIQDMVDAKKEEMKRAQRKDKDDLNMMLEEAKNTQTNVVETRVGDYK